MTLDFIENFDIPGSTPQQRRFTGGRNYASSGLALARASWRALFEKYVRPDMPAKGPISLCITLVYHKKTGTPWKITRPDIDNLAKILIDAMMACRYFNDDNQICVLKISKLYTQAPEYVHIHLEELE